MTRYVKQSIASYIRAVARAPSISWPYTVLKSCCDPKSRIWCGSPMKCHTRTPSSFMSGTRRAIICGWSSSFAQVQVTLFRKKKENYTLNVMLCLIFYIAGTLDILLEQDGCLPESSIKSFGVDICEGLFYIHSLGLLFCDLIPRKVSFYMKDSDFVKCSF